MKSLKIKMRTIEVGKENKPQVWINLYKNKMKNPQTVSQRSPFSVGGLVRISIERGPFAKGYLEGWRKNYYVGNNLTVYKLQDQAGEDKKETFYSNELQKVTEPESYPIGKVISKKRSCWKSPLLCKVERISQ